MNLDINPIINEMYIKYNSRKTSLFWRAQEERLHKKAGLLIKPPAGGRHAEMDSVSEIDPHVAARMPRRS